MGIAIATVTNAVTAIIALRGKSKKPRKSVGKKLARAVAKKVSLAFHRESCTAENPRELNSEITIGEANDVHVAHSYTHRFLDRFDAQRERRSRSVWTNQRSHHSGCPTTRPVSENSRSQSACSMSSAAVHGIDCGPLVHHPSPEESKRAV